MISTLLLATALTVGQCGSCGGGGSYYGGDYGSGGCGSASYYGGNYYSGGYYSGHQDNGYYGVAVKPQLVWQIVNVPGGEHDRYYTHANVYGKRYVIPVINGRLPVITQYKTAYQDKLVLDYSGNYVYTAAYKNGVNYGYTSGAVAKQGPSAVKNFGQEQEAPKKTHNSGAGALKHPDALPQKAVKKDSKLPGPVDAVDRPSDEEIENLFPE